MRRKLLIIFALVLIILTFKTQPTPEWEEENSTNFINQSNLLQAYSSNMPPSLQSPKAVWNKTFGGSDYDYAYSVRQTSDGGYIIAGQTFSFGSGLGDAYLVKIDSAGNLQWNKTFGGSNTDGARSIRQTSDDGYVVVGSTRSFGAGGMDVYLIKIDSSGKLMWNRTFGGVGEDLAYSVQQTKNGGYIIAGIRNSHYATGLGDVYLIKTDSIGKLVWEKTFGGSKFDEAYSVQEANNGGYIIAGRTYSFGSGLGDVYLIRTDSDGSLVWNQVFGGTGEDSAMAVQQTSDGGYALAGWTRPADTSGKDDVYLIKTDSNGNLLWSKTFGGSEYDSAYDVQQTSDGGFVLAGWTTSTIIRPSASLSSEVYLIKTNSSGSHQWNKTYDYSNQAYSVRQTNDGGYIIAGITTLGSGQYDVYVVKTDSGGVWTAINLNLRTVDWSGNVLPLCNVTVADVGSKISDGKGWANFTYVDTGTYSVTTRWQGSKVNQTSMALSTSDVTADVKCHVWTLTVNVKDDAGNFLPKARTQIYMTLPNGTHVNSSGMNIASYRVMNGTFHFAVKWQNNWVYGNTSAALDVTTATKDLYSKVYSINFSKSFQDQQGKPLSPNPDSFRLLCPNGTTTQPLQPRSYFLQNGTFRWKNILWQGSDVTPSSAPTFNPVNGNPTIRIETSKTSTSLMEQIIQILTQTITLGPIKLPLIFLTIIIPILILITIAARRRRRS